MHKNRIFLFSGLALALSIAAFLSPFASKDPDGLDRVSQDLKFEEKATEKPPTKQLPFANVFEEYSVKAIPVDTFSLGIALTEYSSKTVAKGSCFVGGFSVAFSSYFSS